MVIILAFPADAVEQDVDVGRLEAELCTFSVDGVKDNIVPERMNPFATGTHSMKTVAFEQRFVTDGCLIVLFRNKVKRAEEFKVVVNSLYTRRAVVALLEKRSELFDVDARYVQQNTQHVLTQLRTGAAFLSE